MTTDEIMALVALVDPEQRAALRSDIEALQANAQRYQWLCEHTATTGLAIWMRDVQFLDDAIDAAMKAQA